jgi:hypothetical protein
MIVKGTHKVWLNTLKKTSVLFLVFALLFIQIPDAFWQQLHTHEHHDCGLPNVVHEHTPDCTLEQRFISPWKLDYPIFSIQAMAMMGVISIENYFFTPCLRLVQNNNKSPPQPCILFSPT